MVFRRSSITAITRLALRFWALALFAVTLTFLAPASAPLAAENAGLAVMRQKIRAFSVDRSALEKAQPALVAKAVKTWPRTARGKPQVYALSIAAGGSQDIFGREAAAVQSMFAKRLGARAPSLVLSNARKDLFKLPSASRENLEMVLAEIGKRYDPQRDLLVLYITAHGSPDAFVQTDLPDGSWLKPIDAAFLAKALDNAGIKRRVLVISACFSGSWIPALESSDTIVLTAATPYRPSFGCNDSLEFTFYGSAFIKGGLGRGLSWSEAYAELKTTIGLQERSLRFPASGPMADVGDRMTGVWNAPLGPPGSR